MSVETRRYQNRREFVGAHNPEGPYSLRIYDDATAQLGEGNVYVKKTKLTNAQVLLFRATPAILVPAPGANKALIFHKAHIVVDDTATAWTESADNLVIEYADGTDLTTTIETTTLVGGAVKFITVGGIATEIIPDVNAAIELFNSGDGEWGGGNVANSISVATWYSIVDTVAFDSAR